MSIEGVIREEANEIAARLLRRAMELEKEYADLQTQADAVKAKRDSARAAPGRLLNFQVKSGGDYCCPRCWIQRNTVAVLLPRPSQTRDDIFRCAQCGHEIILTY